MGEWPHGTGEQPRRMGETNHARCKPPHDAGEANNASGESPLRWGPEMRAQSIVLERKRHYFARCQQASARFEASKVFPRPDRHENFPTEMYF
jgi:hypothetical protein